MFGLESECEEQCDMQQLTSCVDYLVAMARAGKCRETNYEDLLPQQTRQHLASSSSCPDQNIAPFHSSAIGLLPSPSPSRHYTSIIIDGAAAFTKTNKKKWQQTVTWNETYNAPTMHTLGTE